MIDRDNLKDAKRGIVRGTCDWILTKEVLREWVEEDARRLLWIRGEPYTGKTMLSIFVTQALEAERRILYFFCSAESQQRSTVTAVLRGLLWHLTELFPDLVRAFRERCGSSIDGVLSSRETLWAEFMKLVAAIPREHIYCVVDGLNEYDQDSQEWLAEKFASLEEDHDTPNVKVLVASQEVLGPKGFNQLSLDSDCREKVDNAVRLFVESRADDLFGRFPLSPLRRHDIKTRLRMDAKGSFLWVGFALDELLRQKSETDVIDVLKDSPPDFSELYDRIWNKVPASQRTIRTRILESLALAYRPLTLGELIPLVGCWPQADTPMTETNLRELIGRCAPLFRIVGQTVLLHEFLQNYTDNRFFPSNLRIVPEKVHSRLTEACILSLTQRDSPLAHYGRKSWLSHAREADRLAQELIPHASSDSGDSDYIKSLSGLPLHFTCHLGIKAWAVDILETCKKRSVGLLTDLDREGQTALHIAAAGSQDDIVELLLKHGASVHTRNRKGLTALHLAISKARPKMVKLLLDYGADIYTEDSEGRTVLHIAASALEHANQQTAIKLLFDHDAKQGPDYLTRLALWFTKETFVDSRDRQGRTALDVAVQRRNATMVDLLLKHGADVNSKSEWTKTTPLMYVFRAYEFHTMIRQDEDGAPPMNSFEYAYSILDEEDRDKERVIMRALVDNGAQFDREGDAGRKILQAIGGSGE